MDSFGHPIMRTIPRLGPTPMMTHDPYRDHRAWSIESAVGEVGLDGDWVEYGVWKGDTARLLLEHLPPDSELVLLDSFEGLPEDWYLRLVGAGTRLLRSGRLVPREIPLKP